MRVTLLDTNGAEIGYEEIPDEVSTQPDALGFKAAVLSEFSAEVTNPAVMPFMSMLFECANTEHWNALNQLMASALKVMAYDRANTLNAIALRFNLPIAENTFLEPPDPDAPVVEVPPPPPPESN